MQFQELDKKRTVIAFLDGKKTSDVSIGGGLLDILKGEYNVIHVTNINDFGDKIREFSASITAAIIDIHHAMADDYALFTLASSEVMLGTIPIVVVSRNPISKDDMECISHGASEIMGPPFFKELTIHRIETAIKAKSSKSFHEIENLLKELPSNIFLKDAQGRYVFQTHFWNHIDTGGDPNWTIYGKTDLDIRKDKENALKAMEADREIIRTGKGTNYIIEENSAGKQEFLELIKRPVFDDEGNVTGIIAIINNVTEAETLRRRLDLLAHTDELTGLGNHRSFDDMVASISSRDDFPIAVISADCDGLKVINDTLGHIVGDEYIRLAACVFSENLPDGAQAFRTGGDEFVAFIPNTSKEEAIRLAEKMTRQNAMLSINGHEVSVSYGADIIADRYENVIEAVSRADKGMYEAKSQRMKARPEYYLYSKNDPRIKWRGKGPGNPDEK